MLERKDLRRRHQRALSALLNRAHQGGEGHDRLARTDVALQQSLHGLRAVEVGFDCGEHVLLRCGEREGQGRTKGC